MFTDVTGIILTPGNHGEQCLGNGRCYDKNGNRIECCCEECQAFLTCFPEYTPEFLKNKKDIATHK